MARKSKTQQLIEKDLGEYLALSVAAHLARTQRVPDALKVYDSEHLAQMVDVLARALAKVTTLYVQESNSPQRRELTPEEIEGVTISRSATLVQLKDGRKFSSISVKRGDLRQAIAILKAVGIPEIGGRLLPDIGTPAAPKRATPGELLARLYEMETLLVPPLLPAQVARINRLAVWIAREAGHGKVANIAMRLLSAIHESQATGALDENARALLALLRMALEEASASARAA